MQKKKFQNKKREPGCFKHKAVFCTLKPVALSQNTSQMLFIICFTLESNLMLVVVLSLKELAFTSHMGMIMG